MASLDLFRNADNARTYAEGDVIYRVGDVGDEMLAVIEGTCEIFVGGRLMATLGPGDIVGEMALIDERHVRAAEVKASTSLRVAPIDRRQFEFMLRNHPSFAIEVMRTMAERLRTMNDHYASRSS